MERKFLTKRLSQSRSPVIVKGEPIKHRDHSGKQRGQSKLATAYLILYNVGSLIAWLFFSARFMIAWSQAGSDLTFLSNSTLFILSTVQSIALLEVLHAAIRLVPSPVLTTAVQIASRLFVVWVVGFGLGAAGHWGFPLLAIAWTLSDVTRYIYYTVNLCCKVPRWLVWLRYSLFLVLYPAGTTGEMGLIYNAMSMLTAEGSAGRWPLLALLLVYPFGFFFMYYHMLKQRRRYLIFVA